MGKIYVGQTDLSIQLNTGKNITNAQSVKVKYRNPSGTTGEFNASIVNALTGVIKYDVASVNDITVVGNWTFWAKIVDFQGLISLGEPSTIMIYKEGS